MSSKKRILIVSVYAPSVYNQHWYELQKRFIKKNTIADYDFKVIVNNVEKNLFDNGSVIFFNEKNIGHPAGLRQAFKYMRSHNNYDGYLILDSDAFPVVPGWNKILDQQMTVFNKSIAAPIRYENLDRFPHPCVVYMNQSGLENENINFDYAKIENLLGDEINEVGGSMLKVMDQVLPLLRTNRLNVHPVASAIYHHMFYHHGAGSRGFEFRLYKLYEYYSHWKVDEDTVEFGDKLMASLLGGPEQFVDKLLYGV